MDKGLVVGGRAIAPGEHVSVDLPLPPLYTHTPLTMPVHVVRGRRDGPRLFVCAAIHGDELNGVEIIRRLLQRPLLRSLRGTLLAVPIVNVYGVIDHSRYLPDGRDLNRCFPGLEGGSLAARVADLFMSEIVSQATHGIDLHTGARHRTNLPQVRGNLDDEHTASLANVFGVPVLINANLRDGSLRQSAAELGIPMLIYEAGEALRFDEVAIRAGVHGVINVMRMIGMLPRSRTRQRTAAEPFVARSSTWVRAPGSGILRTAAPLGGRVSRGDVLAWISDPSGNGEREVVATAKGVIIGRTRLPLVLEGEALFHIARFREADEVAENVELFHASQEAAIISDSVPPVI
jgi:predicted deacylase